jgi:hypothetical protein
MISFTLGPVPPVKRPIPRSTSLAHEIFDLDVSSSSDDSAMSTVNLKQKKPSPPYPGGPPRHRPPLPHNPPQLGPDQVPITQGGQRQSQSRQPNPLSTNSTPGLGVECDHTCDCALFTGSELEKDVEVGGKKILVADLKHFFRRAADGTWTCKKCA